MLVKMCLAPLAAESRQPMHAKYALCTLFY